MITKHMDKRSHSIFFRKCMKELGDKPCKHRLEFPPTISQSVIKDLPRRDSGGLFYDVVEDPKHPGHNMTFLSHVKAKNDIIPDGDLDVERCKVRNHFIFPFFSFQHVLFQEENCLYVFKSGADSVKHMVLIHGKSGKEANPLGHVCHHLVDGVVCGLVFETPWFLNKHKKQAMHFIPRNRKTNPGN